MIENAPMLRFEAYFKSHGRKMDLTNECPDLAFFGWTINKSDLHIICGIKLKPFQRKKEIKWMQFRTKRKSK